MIEESSRRAPGRNCRAGETVKCLPVFLRHPAFKIFALITLILVWNDPARTADRLVEAATSGRIQTAGGWRDLVRRVERLPDSLRTWTWQRLRERLGAGPVAYLRRWREERRRGP